MVYPKKGEPYPILNKAPGILEGIPAIAAFIGKSGNTTLNWINKHGLPATKTPTGRWFTHRGLILQWIYAGHQAELKAKTAFALEEDQVMQLAEKMGISPDLVREKMGIGKDSG